ncbi:MAG: response regulator [Spirochaetaceae bacterium]
MKKILLIDDDIIILKTYEHIFKNLNYQLTAISDSKKGLEIAINEDFDVILTDNKMPNLTGIELILELKKVKKDVNIYLLTGFIEKDQLKLLKSIGVTGIIEKPFSSSQIISLLE